MENIVNNSANIRRVYNIISKTLKYAIYALFLSLTVFFIINCKWTESSVWKIIQVVLGFFMLAGSLFFGLFVATSEILTVTYKKLFVKRIASSADCSLHYRLFPKFNIKRMREIGILGPLENENRIISFFKKRRSLLKKSVYYNAKAEDEFTGTIKYNAIQFKEIKVRKCVGDGRDDKFEDFFCAYMLEVEMRNPYGTDLLICTEAMNDVVNMEDMLPSGANMLTEMGLSTSSADKTTAYAAFNNPALAECVSKIKSVTGEMLQEQDFIMLVKDDRTYLFVPSTIDRFETDLFTTVTQERVEQDMSNINAMVTIASAVLKQKYPEFY